MPNRARTINEIFNRIWSVHPNAEIAPPQEQGMESLNFKTKRMYRVKLPNMIKLA